MIFFVSSRFRRALFVWALATVVLTATGPFGTFAAMGLVDRAVFWGAAIGTAIVISLVLLRLLIPRLSGYSPLLRDLAMAFAMSACFTPVLFLLKAQYLNGATSPLGVLETAAVVFAVPLALGLARAGFRATEPPDPVPPPAPRLADRLDPPARDGRILVLSGRDHCIDVFTDAGQAEIRMRFSDALRELDGLDGMQIHRSHWVSDAAVTAIARDGSGKVLVILPCGRRLPVSRTHRAAALARWGARGNPDGAGGRG
jgi:hypothetical protein